VASPGKEEALRERCEAALVKANLKPEGIKGISGAIRQGCKGELIRAFS
jgi:hypothetical protein